MCSENIHCIISLRFNLLRLVVWPGIWSILENVPCTLEKNVYSAVIGWSVLYLLHLLLFKPFISLLIFCQVVLYINESGISKSPTVIVEWPTVSAFISVNFYFMYFSALLGASIIDNCVLLLDWPFYHYKMSLSIIETFFVLYAILLDICILSSAFL